MLSIVALSNNVDVDRTRKGATVIYKTSSIYKILNASYNISIEQVTFLCKMFPFWFALEKKKNRLCHVNGLHTSEFVFSKSSNEKSK